MTSDILDDIDTPFEPPLAKCLQDGLNIYKQFESHQSSGMAEFKSWTIQGALSFSCWQVPDKKYLCLDCKDNFRAPVEAWEQRKPVDFTIFDFVFFK